MHGDVDPRGGKPRHLGRVDQRQVRAGEPDGDAAQRAGAGVGRLQQVAEPPRRQQRLRGGAGGEREHRGHGGGAQESCVAHGSWRRVGSV